MRNIPEPRVQKMGSLCIRGFGSSAGVILLLKRRYHCYL